MTGVVLSLIEVRRLCELLRLLRSHLKSSIESATLSDGSIPAYDRIAVRNVPSDRRDLRTTEKMIERLSLRQGKASALPQRKKAR